ncbi:MAG: phospho-sugar mutase [Pseudomonadota bacterium]
MQIELDELGARMREVGGSAAEAQAAASALEAWLTEPDLAAYRPAIEGLVSRSRWELLFDGFRQLLPFGTGGRRGAVGVGPNRINPVTVRDAVQGHCLFLRARAPRGDLRVVLAADVRVYHDVRGHYVPGTLGPLDGISSIDFCRLAAEVYAGNGVEVLMEDPSSGYYVSTPELSFLIRHRDAHGGLNMSASHNPPDDNGAKFYNREGGQEVPPHDQALVETAAQVATIRSEPFDAAVAAGRVRFLGAGDHGAYVGHNVGLSLDPSLRGARVAFSNLHGCGATTVLPVLRAAGFEVVVAEDQASMDGRFPTVPYLTPNPEVPSAMLRVIEVARGAGAQLALATDPDADRLGLAAPGPDGVWRTFTGNQIAALVLAHGLEGRAAAGRLSPRDYVIKTEVTTDLLRRMAEAAGVRCVGHLLVGFKYIGAVIAAVKNTGEWHDLKADETNFICAMEESHGVLVTPAIRDKDAAGGALWLAELASAEATRGRTLWDRLYDLYRTHGVHGTALRSVIMEGSAGVQRIRAIQKSLREDPPTSVNGRKVEAFQDRQDPAGVFGRILSETDRASRDVLVFGLEGGARLILRPSGTEPKNKSYLEVATPPLGSDASVADVEATLARLDREAAALLDWWEVELLRRAGLDFPPYALRFSGLIPLDKKMHFTGVLDPELRRRLQADAPAAVAAWLAAELPRVGAVELLEGGLAAFGETLREDLRAAWTAVLGAL